MFLKGGSVGKQSGVSGAPAGPDPAFRFHDDRLLVAARRAVGSSSVDGDNGGSVEMLQLSPGRNAF